MIARRSYDRRMQSRKLSDNEYILVFTYPDVEVMQALQDFAVEHNVQSGRLQAIGSVSSATLAWWSNTTKAIEKTTFDGQFEVVSFLGNISANDACPRIHAHTILTGPSGIVAGHTVSLTPRASVEVSMTVFPTPFERQKSADFGLCIIGLDE
jgi:predicted DNA-binding protein with PD1-like motif